MPPLTWVEPRQFKYLLRAVALSTEAIAVLSFVIGLVNYAGVAQLVEQLICNQPVASSSLVTSFKAN